MELMLSSTQSHLIDISKKFFDRINKIREKEMYSRLEVESLIKDLERLDVNDFPELPFYIDCYFEEKERLVTSIISLERFRAIFHKVLKDANLNPIV